MTNIHLDPDVRVTLTGDVAVAKFSRLLRAQRLPQIQRFIERHAFGVRSFVADVRELPHIRPSLRRLLAGLRSKAEATGMQFAIEGDKPWGGLDG